MRFHRESAEEAVRGGRAKWLLRSLLIVALTLVIALVVWVRPLPEPDADELSPVPTSAAPSTPAVGVASVATDTPVPTSSPTATPSPSPAPSLTPTPLASPTETASPTPIASPTPVQVVTITPQQVTRAPLAGRVEQGLYFSQVTGKEEPYRVYLPPGYDQEDRRYPVLYLLHGWPYDESHWDNLGVDEVADVGIVQGVFQPFIIVLPGADAHGLYVTSSGGAGSFEEQLVNELMPHIDATFRSVQTREARAIGGISRGGVWSLEIAFRHPDAFGIVGAHSPALSASRAPAAFDPFALLNEPGVAGLRIYLSAGDADWALQMTVELHQALEAQGIAHQLDIHAGAHQDLLWQQHIGEYLAFYTAGW